MKIFFISIGALMLLLVGFLLWSSSQPRKESTLQPGVVSVKGLHWHPELTIYAKGEKVEVPQNIGIGATHRPMHTHDDLPVIHLEFSAFVREEDITLKRFFEIWGKDMQSFGTNVKMMVNGKENTELGEYVMQDGDKIELRYE